MTTQWCISSLKRKSLTIDTATHSASILFMGDNKAVATLSQVDFLFLSAFSASGGSADVKKNTSPSSVIDTLFPNKDGFSGEGRSTDRGSVYASVVLCGRFR